MIFHCKAALNTESQHKKIAAYQKEVDEYDIHLTKMDDDDLYRLANAELVMNPPVAPKPETGYVRCNFRNESIIGYEVSGKDIMILINFSMTGQGSYIIKYDDKVIKELDKLLG